MAIDSRVYYHGTWAGYGHALMTRGFELGHEGRGNLLGRGVYIAQTLAAAAHWTPSDFIITCRLTPGTRILWVEESYDRRVINYLEREFGRELIALGPHFYRSCKLLSVKTCSSGTVDFRQTAHMWADGYVDNSLPAPS